MDRQHATKRGELIAFPARAAVQRSGPVAPGPEEGTVVLFTGVRYERFGAPAQARTALTTEPQPRSGGWGRR